MTIPPSEEIICREIVTNDNNSPIVNADPLFNLFSTEMFDPSSDSVEELEKYLSIVDAEDNDNGESEKGATLSK